MGGFYQFTITLNYGVGRDRAVNYMNALCKFLKHRMISTINCEVLIGLSDSAGKQGRYIAAKQGKVGRPRRIYVGTPNAKIIDQRDWHIHMLLHGRNTDYIIKQTRKHIENNIDIIHSYSIDEKSMYVGSTIDYVDRQCLKYRYIVNGNEIEAPLRKWVLAKYGNKRKGEGIK